MDIVLGIAAVVCLIMGFLGSFVAKQKNRDEAEGFFLGLLFGPLGVLVEALLPTPAATANQPASNHAPSRPPPGKQAQRDQDLIDHFARVQQEALEKERQRGLAALARHEAERLERVDRRARSDKAYLALGIEPGPFAWFWALPDLAQALLMGLAIAVPAVLALLAVFRKVI